MVEFLKKIFTPQILISIAYAAIAVAVYLGVRKYDDSHGKRSSDTGSGATVRRILFSVLRIVIIVVAVIAILRVNGTDISAMIAGLGIASAIIGLALQDYLKDMIMGLHIVSDHFFSVGDCIEYNGREGVVLDMTLKSTKIGDLDDHSITTVCNHNITEVRRLAKRLDIDVLLTFDSDLEAVHRAFAVMTDMISALEHVTKCEFLGIQDFTDSGILFRLRIFCEPHERADVRRLAQSIIFDQIGAGGLHVPFNQLDVHCDITEKK